MEEQAFPYVTQSSCKRGKTLAVFNGFVGQFLDSGIHVVCSEYFSVNIKEGSHEMSTYVSTVFNVHI